MIFYNSSGPLMERNKFMRIISIRIIFIIKNIFI